MAISYTNFSGGVTAYNPLDTDYQLRDNANYLYNLCNKYVAEAKGIYYGSGEIINPSQPFAGLIRITSINFANATEYNNQNIVGRDIQVFWNDISRYLVPNTEWQFTATGIKILVEGFDAQTSDYTLYIYIN